MEPKSGKQRALGSTSSDHDRQLEQFQRHPLPNGKKKPMTRLEKVILQLYGRGLRRGEIAQLVGRHMFPEWNHNRVMQMRLTRRRLISYEERQWFRDALYNQAVVTTDLSIPQILEGVVKKAKRGRVDAAKLTLAVTGRSVDQEGAVNVPIQINFPGQIARPYGPEASIAGQDEAEVVEDAEFEELD